MSQHKIDDSKYFVESKRIYAINILLKVIVGILSFFAIIALGAILDGNPSDDASSFLVVCIVGIAFFSIPIYANHKKYKNMREKEEEVFRKNEKDVQKQIDDFNHWIQQFEVPAQVYLTYKNDELTNVGLPYRLWINDNNIHFLIDPDFDNPDLIQLTQNDVLEFYKNIHETDEMSDLFEVNKFIISFYKNDNKSLMSDNSLSYQQKQEKIKNWFTSANVTYPRMRRYILSFAEKERFFQIPLLSIQYYRVVGDLRYQTDITGGGGGGSSIGGAIVGGMIAGGVGAIIGSRKKVEAIRSETIQIDDRYIELVFLDDSGSKKIMKFDYCGLDVFEELIPDKEYSIVQEKKRRKLLGDKDIENNIVHDGSVSINQQDILSQIEKLFDMKERGIITEDEFIEKKKALLNNM